MTSDNKQRLWRQARSRFQTIDWERPVTPMQVDALHAALSKRRPDESVQVWLQRALAADAVKFTPFTQIIRRAASSRLEDYPLPDCDFLLTEDESLRFAIKEAGGNITLKAEALGLAIETLGNRTLGIAYRPEPQDVVAMIELDAAGEGEICAADTWELRRALSNPLIGLIE